MRGWNRFGYALFAAAGLSIVALPLIALSLLPTADSGPMGWAGPSAVKATAAWTRDQPPFFLRDAQGLPVWQDNVRANVRLWHKVKSAAGTYPRNVPQEIGDCTSWGGKHAIEATAGAQIATGKPGEFKEVYAPWLYGASRVWILKGQLGRGDGSTGSATAQAAKEFGVLPSDAPGLPPYSGSVAKRWGQSGPPPELKAIAAQHKVKTVALCRSAADVRDAICNGFGVTIASDWGSNNNAMKPQDGRIVARRSGRWMHQMCVDGYDGSHASGNRYFHVQNSWGESAHPKPIDDSPPGGFWVLEADIEYITKQGDTWAFSDFDGFPARDLDFSSWLSK